MKKAIQKFIDKLYVTINPSFWIDVGDVDNGWDNQLNRLLDEVETGDVELVRDDAYHVKFVDGDKSITVWVRNYPYCFGYARSEILPKKVTRLRLKRVVDSIDFINW